MPRLIFILLMLSVPLMVFAQGKCMSTEQTMIEIERDLEFASGYEAFQDLSTEFEQGMHDQALRDGFKETVVPVVVHVLYRLEANNISYDQILSQIDVLNRDFNWLQGDKNKIPESWRGLGASAKFTFRLADKDPDGNFTNGVTRTKTEIENIGSKEIYYLPNRGGAEPWNQAFYMNIWVCELEGNSLGFAILPGANMSSRDGIVISPRAFGTLGTAKAPYNEGRTLVHEVGHYFGLRHLWGDDNESCGSTDHIDDTPKQKAENYGCKLYPSISCNNGPDGDMFVNFMDYSNDSCALLFTKRQVEFMQLVFKTNRRAMFYSNGVTGVREVAPTQMLVYPNPSNGVVHLEFKEEIPEQLLITDALGSTVLTLRPSRSIERIDLSHLAAGVYYLRSPEMQQTLIIH